MADLLSGAVDREVLDQLNECIYDSYTNYDQASACAQDLVADREEADEEEQRDLNEKIGLLLFAMGEYERAAETLGRVSRRKTAAHLLGRAYLKTDREEEALELLERGRSDEQDAETDLLELKAYCRLRRNEEAEETLERLRGQEPPAQILCYAEGLVAEAAGRYGEGMEHYEQALEEEPEHAPSLFRLALNCDMNGDDERAIELYEKCVGLRPTFVGALINLGILYEDHGEYRDAIECYKRVLAIDPRHKQAQLYLKDAESSLTMYINVSRSKRLRQMEELFGLPEGAPGAGELPGGGAAALGAPTPEAASQAATGTDPELQQKLNTAVEELNLSTRSRKCMERLDISTVGELIEHTAEELLTTPNFGSTSIEEVRSKLAEMDLSLKGEESE
ncbi:MAG: tetratricopeptide repeat protein [Planctomycetota bacterium]